MKTTIISLNSFIYTSIGEIYRLSPDFKPRNISEITNQIINLFKIDAQQVGSEFFYHEVAISDIRMFTENILMQIDEFRELNLSQNEYVRGIKVDDPNRGPIQFISAHDVPPSYDAFVDLDACIRNIANIIINENFQEFVFNKISDSQMEEYLHEFYEDKED